MKAWAHGCRGHRGDWQVDFVARRRDPVDRRRVVIRANPKKIEEVDVLYDSIADFLERTTIVLTEETQRLRS